MQGARRTGGLARARLLTSTMLVVAVAAAAFGVAGSGAVVAVPESGHGSMNWRGLSSVASLRSAPPARKLVFGIYPGGGAGTVAPAGRTVAEDPTRRLEALQQL